MLRFTAHKILYTADGTVPLNVSFVLKKGECAALFGNSGEGKTTILRILAGLTPADKTIILADGEVWDNSENKIHLPVRKRSIGFVFQDFALFPHLTVKRNLEYALPKNSNAGIIDELLEMMELHLLQNTMPHNLSGGQKQRVALARAIVRQPKILLLDEPLSALDDEMRFKLQNYILRARSQYNLTILLVSHNISEIIKLADRAMILAKGKIQKEGKPVEVFPADYPAGECKLTAKIIDIKKSGTVYTLKLIADGKPLTVTATEEEMAGLKNALP